LVYASPRFPPGEVSREREYSCGLGPLSGGAAGSWRPRVDNAHILCYVVPMTSTVAGSVTIDLGKDLDSSILTGLAAVPSGATINLIVYKFPLSSQAYYELRRGVHTSSTLAKDVQYHITGENPEAVGAWCQVMRDLLLSAQTPIEESEWEEVR